MISSYIDTITPVCDRADVTLRDQFLWTPLHHAAFAGQVELVQLLVKAGSPINTPSLNGGTPLMNAILSSRPSCVNALIQAGASVTAENKGGMLGFLYPKMFNHTSETII